VKNELMRSFLFYKKTIMAKYDKKTVKRICDLIARDSYTVDEICEKVGIANSTYFAWMNEKPEFSESIKKARDKFDELIASEAKKSLVKLIQGYTVQEKKTVTVDTGKKDDDGKPIMRVKEHSVTDKHYQPVTAAVIFALTNRDPERWKNRQTNEHTGKDGKDLFEGFNPATLSDE
jgi:transposase-like protein